MATQYILHRLIRQSMTQVGKGADNAVISPAGVLPRHPDHQSFQLWSNPGSAWVLAVSGAIELPADQLLIPSQDGIRLGDAGDLSESFPPKAFSDLSEGGTLRIAQSQSRWQLLTQTL
jgi:hypothetical protein